MKQRNHGGSSFIKTSYYLREERETAHLLFPYGEIPPITIKKRKNDGTYYHNIRGKDLQVFLPLLALLKNRHSM